MSSLNKIILIGSVEQEPDTRVTDNGDPYVRFPLLVERPARMDGLKPASDLIQIVAWRSFADNINYSQGSTLLVEGNIQTRSFDDNEGKRKWVTEVEARNVKVLSNIGKEAAPISPAKEEAPEPIPEANQSLEEKPLSNFNPADFDFNDAELKESDLKKPQDEVPF